MIGLVTEQAALLPPTLVEVEPDAVDRVERGPHRRIDAARARTRSFSLLGSPAPAGELCARELRLQGNASIQRSCEVISFGEGKSAVLRSRRFARY
jgi:hypothetical protein